MAISRLAGGLLAAALLLTGCGGDRSGPSGQPAAKQPAAPAARSEILITIESVAARRLAIYGGPIAVPKLAALAASGTVYGDATSVAPLSRPSLVTILTGLAPDRSGVRDNIHDAVPSSLPTLAEGARAAGFETAAFVATPFASYSSGLDRGFGLFDGPEAIVVGPAQHAPPVVPAAEVANHFKVWLPTRTPGKPFFVWIHLADLNGRATTMPSEADKSKAQGMLDEYDKTVAAIDAAIGSVVEAVGADTRAGEVGVLVAGTHGAYLGEGGRFGDTFWLADETLRVPLVRVPRLGAATSAAQKPDARPTWLPDVAATLARAFHATLPEGADGIPLDAPADPGRVRLAWAYSLDDQLALPPRTAVREGAGFNVFETKASGADVAPVEGGSAPAPAAAAARRASPRPRALPDERRQAIERAGIKIGKRSEGAAWPKDANAWLDDLQLMRVFFSKDQRGMAMRRTRVLLEREPQSLAAMVARLYGVATAPTPLAEAQTLRDKLLARYPARSDALHWAAHLSLTDGKLDAAAALLDAAIAVGPVEPEMLYDRACVDARRGDAKAALAGLDTSIRAGFRNWVVIDSDPDLATIRTNPGYPELLRAHGR